VTIEVKDINSARGWTNRPLNIWIIQIIMMIRIS